MSSVLPLALEGELAFPARYQPSAGLVDEVSRGVRLAAVDGARMPCSYACCAPLWAGG
jgi:hypothetical protein